MQTRFIYLLRLVLAVSDLLLLNAAFIFSFYISILPGNFPDFSQYSHYLLIINLLWVLTAAYLRMYTDYTLKTLEKIYRRTWRSVLGHGVMFMCFLLLSNDHGFQGRRLVLFYAFLSGAFLLSRFAGTYMQMVLLNKFKLRKPVAVLGMNNTGLRLQAFFEQNKANYDFDGFLDEEDGFYVDERGQLLPATVSQIQNAAKRGIKEIFVSLTPDRMTQAGQLLLEAEKQCVRLKFVPDLTGSLAAPFSVQYMGDFPVISLRPEPLDDVHNRFKKRAFDILFSSLVIVFVLSWLYPLIALLIKLQSPGPVLFRQLRSGRNNDSFWCYKFRSMRVNKDSDSRQASKNDDRITPVGRFLRKSSLDELPQFINVLLGDMSVIGPRPHMLKQTEQYAKIINQYMVRHFLKPGISGWAQVNGFRGETKDDRLMEKRVEHDIWYMENWSMMLDIRIIFMTIINMIRGEENAH